MSGETAVTADFACKQSLLFAIMQSPSGGPSAFTTRAIHQQQENLQETEEIW